VLVSLSDRGGLVRLGLLHCGVTLGVSLADGFVALACRVGDGPVGFLADCLAGLLVLDDSVPEFGPGGVTLSAGGFGVGLAAGALIGGALAAPYYGGYYGYGYPAYGYGYGYGYPAYGYGGYGYGYPAYGYSSYGYAPAYSGGYGYASPYYGRGYYAYGGPRIHRHWVHRTYHRYAY